MHFDSEINSYMCIYFVFPLGTKFNYKPLSEESDKYTVGSKSLRPHRKPGIFFFKATLGSVLKISVSK